MTLTRKGEVLYEGKSKRILSIDEELCLITLLPTLDSYTYDRHEIFNGTAEIRLDFYEMAVGQLHSGGLRTCWVDRISSTSYIAQICKIPPFEVIVKNRAVGSTQIKYPGLFEPLQLFIPPIVKFDYRTDPEDQAIADDYVRAAGINVEEYKNLALATNEVLIRWLSPLILLDFCIIPGLNFQEELVITSEISPDSMRLRNNKGESLDKDLFREGASADLIIKVWRSLLESLKENL